MVQQIEQLEQLKFVEQMGILSKKTFKEVYDTNQDFVDFTRVSMSQGKGIFKYWIQYVQLRSKAKHAWLLFEGTS